MVALLTLDAGKQHLRVDHDDDDIDIARKIEQASEIVLDYIQQPDAANIPLDKRPIVEAATALMLSSLYDDREAGEADNAVALGYLPRAVTALLHRLRDPALA